MKQPSPEARCPPAVAASLFLLPWPAATICSINQSPGASGANTHTHTHACTRAHTHPQAYILQQLLAQLMPHMALHPPLHPSLPPSLSALLQTQAPSFSVEAIWPSEACGSTDTSAYMLLLFLKGCTVSCVLIKALVHLYSTRAPRPDKHTPLSLCVVKQALVLCWSVVHVCESLCA